MGGMGGKAASSGLSGDWHRGVSGDYGLGANGCEPVCRPGLIYHRSSYILVGMADRTDGRTKGHSIAVADAKD